MKKNQHNPKSNDPVYIRYQQIKISVIILAIAITITAVATVAWYAHNREVIMNTMEITSDSASQNMFIRMKSDSEKNFETAITSNWQGSLGLYPISTANCKNWYTVNQWKSESITTGNVTKVTKYAYGYAEITDISEGLYNDGKRRAYFATDFNIYTDKDSLDVYLDSSNPMKITYEKSANRDLSAAIRVALVDTSDTKNPVIKFVYAPENETAVGKNYISADAKQAAPGFYGVTGANSAIVMNESIMKTGDTKAALAGFEAEGSSDSYTKLSDAQKLCTATPDGANLTVYVWLEGMDADAIIGTSDGETSGINVQLNFVGVEP